MFLKRLVIRGKQGLIRDILFHKGVNLIVDERSEEQRQKTGNNVGKTTVLRLIDYCFGSKGKDIYKDKEFSDQPNTTIEIFLKEEKTIVTVELIEDLEDTNSKKITIERNFLGRKDKILKINGKTILPNKFDLELKESIFKTNVGKPTCRQIISKNIRIEKDRMDNIVRVLGAYVSKETYEALFLFWLGINTDIAEEKIRLTEEKKREENFRKRLQKDGKLPLIEQKLTILNEKIAEEQQKKTNFNLNESYYKDIEHLNRVKFKLNKLSSKISQLKMRKSLIIESKDSLDQEYASINTNQIKALYKKADALIPNIQISFEETLKFHNELIEEKRNYITKNLPELEQKIESSKAEFDLLLKAEIDLTKKLQKSGVAEDLEKIIAELNKQHERKGHLEEQKCRWERSNIEIARIEKELEKINKDISSNDDLIKSRVTLFNRYFTKISKTLYGEDYFLTYSQENANYDLIVTNIESNPGTGKKKGQIAAFDFAYIQFADDLGMECLHFIMHDQLENIHDNQLNTLIDVAKNINGQYIVPILKDKIPKNIDIDKFKVLSLSQDQKLFKVP